MNEQPTLQGEQELVDRFLEENVLFMAPDMDIMLSHGLSEISPIEQNALNNLPDPDTMSIIRARLETGCTESFELVEQMGAAPGAKWGDLIVGVFSVGGDLSVASMGGVLLFSILAQMPVKFMVRYWENEPSVGLKPGDIFVHNDTRYGNVHNADFSVILPIFDGDKLVCFAGCIVHEGENGSCEPGGIPPSAESPFDEGLRMPPMRVGENYTLRRDVVTFLQHSTREPKLMLAGLKSRLHACIRVQKRVEELINAYGSDAVIGTIRQTLIDTEAAARDRLRAWPDGIVRTTSFSDSTLRENVLMKLNVALEKRDDELVIDFRGSAPEIQNRSVNTIVSSLKAMLAQQFLTYVWPDLPRNQAVFAPITVKTDDKSIMHCSDDAATAQAMMSFFPAFGGVQRCCAKFLYSSDHRSTEIISNWWHMIDTLLHAGVTQHGEPIGNIGPDINGMGGAARWNRDGEHAIAPIFATMVDLGEQELIEEELPMLRLTWQGMQQDKQGYGKFRGGHGGQNITTVKDTPMWAYVTSANQSKFPTGIGLFGGYSSGCTPLCKVKGVNIFDIAESNPEVFTDYTIVDIMNNQPFEGATYTTHHMGMTPEVSQPGELYMIQMGPGSGYGDVLERDPQSVAKDYREGLISLWTAENVYAVILDPETSAVDEGATDEARAAVRKARLARGKSYEEFVAGWQTEKPPAHLPYFGSWDDPTVLHRGSPDDTCTTDNIQPVFLPNPHEAEVIRLRKELDDLVNKELGGVGHT
ncbi:MAG: hydantoinase B/oxoprolinase family protein [Pseudomonadota bacterium]